MHVWYYMCMLCILLVLHTGSCVILWEFMNNPAIPPVVTLGCHTIARVYQYTYLGVTLSADLSWDKHIHVLCTKAKKMLGLLYRSFYPNSSASSLLKLYISLIRPLLEYACQVWNPYLTKNIEKLEKVQRFALRLCVKQWDLDYPSLLSSLTCQHLLRVGSTSAFAQCSKSSTS